MRNPNQKLTPAQMNALTLIANSDRFVYDEVTHTATAITKVSGMSKSTKITWATFDILNDLGLIEKIGERSFLNGGQDAWISEKASHLF